MSIPTEPSFFQYEVQVLPLINSINKLKYLSAFWDRDPAGASFAIAFSVSISSIYLVHSQDWHSRTVTAGRHASVSEAVVSLHFFSTG